MGEKTRIGKRGARDGFLFRAKGGGNDWAVSKERI